MDNIKIYEVNPSYINYLAAFAPHLFHNKKQGQQNTRKNAASLYRLKVVKHETTPLTKRCNDFLLEEACRNYKRRSK